MRDAHRRGGETAPAAVQRSTAAHSWALLRMGPGGAGDKRGGLGRGTATERDEGMHDHRHPQVRYGGRGGEGGA